MKVMRAVVRAESMSIKMLKINKKDDVIADDKSDSQLDLKVKVIKFN